MTDVSHKARSHAGFSDGILNPQAFVRSPVPTDEYTKTEAPFMHQLASMGWETEDGDPDVEYLSGNRARFDEVLLKGDLRAALRRINRTAGKSG